MKRKLKVEEFNPGAKYRANPATTIRLKGQWLQRAGFLPGQHVTLTVVSPGVIELRLCGMTPKPSADYYLAADRLDHAIEKDKARRGQ